MCLSSTLRLCSLRWIKFMLLYSRYWHLKVVFGPSLQSLTLPSRSAASAARPLSGRRGSGLSQPEQRWPGTSWAEWCPVTERTGRPCWGRGSHLFLQVHSGNASFKVQTHWLGGGEGDLRLFVLSRLRDKLHNLHAADEADGLMWDRSRRGEEVCNIQRPPRAAAYTVWKDGGLVITCHLSRSVRNWWLWASSVHSSVCIWLAAGWTHGCQRLVLRWKQKGCFTAFTFLV